MRDIDGIEAGEVCNILGISETNQRVPLHRARSRVRAALKAHLRPSCDFVDGALPGRARLQIRMHLMMCRFCRAYVRQMALMVRTLRQLPREEPSDAAKKDLLDAIRAGRE